MQGGLARAWHHSLCEGTKPGVPEHPEHHHAATNNMKAVQDDTQKELEEGAEPEGFIHEKSVLQARPLLPTPGQAAKSPRAMFSHIQPTSRAWRKGYRS